MRLIIALLVIVAIAEGSSIYQTWYTDGGCSAGANIVTLNNSQCYYSNLHLTGMKWTCDNSGNVVADIYPMGDYTCSQNQIGQKVFAPKTCTGPVYNLYLECSGC